ncbi:MAG: flagellar assembly protein FliW [Bryobacterales bacterium]|nr:flagellar assembly protein FliW [Bryobacterales bacterium]
MPEFQTRYFGEIAYLPESVIEYPVGLPGFENERRFLLIEQELNKPLVFLQSLSRPELCFITVPVQGILPDYELTLTAEELHTLELAEDRQPVVGEDVIHLAIVSLAEDRPATANLLAPIVINWRKRLAVQSVQADSSYSHQHPLLARDLEPQCS